MHLMKQLACLPLHLSNLALHDAFPGLVAGELHLPCTECAISPATKALELFAALPEEQQRHLTVSGVNCIVSPFDQSPVVGESAHAFRAALLRCCRPVESLELTLALEGQCVDLTPVLQALASSSTLRNLQLTSPSAYTFTSSGNGEGTPERHLSNEPTIACWDASCFKLLTYLSIENAGFSVCAHHFGATVVHCVELRHLGVHLSLGKCIKEAASHDHAWLSRLTLLSSLTLRWYEKLPGNLEDDEEQVDAGSQRRSEVYWYLRRLLAESLPSLKLKTLDLADNVVEHSLMQCIVSELSCSLEELSTVVTMDELYYEKDARCLVNLLRGAVQLRKLCLLVKYEFGIKCLGKHLCCLPSLEHLQLNTNCERGLPSRTFRFGHGDGEEGSREPTAATVSDLTHISFRFVGNKSWELKCGDLTEGFTQNGLAHLTTLRCIDVLVENAGSVDDFDREGAQVVAMVGQQPHLETLGLFFNCNLADPEDGHHIIAEQYVAGLEQALRDCSYLSCLKLIHCSITAEGVPLMSCHPADTFG